MGRVQGKIDWGERQYSVSTHVPAQLVTFCALAFCLFAGTAFSQTSPARSTDSSHNEPSGVSADSELQVANPFATPWLLDRRVADPMSTGSPGPSGTQNPAEKLPKTTYKLEPDPFDLDLSQSASKDDARAALRSRTPEPDTAQRLAAIPRVKVQPLKSQQKNSMYDVTRIGDRDVGKNLNFYSVEKEEALGKEISQQVEQQAKIVNDPVITEYVNRIGQNLVRHSDAKVPFTIKVVDDEQVNAFALPGGFFYVNTGVLLAADNEAELAGVMAHEIAHVAARHATRNATKQDIWNLASLPLIFVGGPMGAAIRELSGIAFPMSFLKFSRDAEREADFLGLEYQYASGYDPTAFVDFFERLEAREKQHSGFMARAFSTHPMNDDRIRRAEAELEMLPARDDYVLTTSEFEQVKSRLIRLTRGRTADDGKALPTLRKHTVEDDGPPVLKKSPGTLQ